MCGCDACKRARAQQIHSLAYVLRTHFVLVRTAMASSLYVNGGNVWWVEEAEGKPNKCVYLNLLFNKKSVKSQQCLAQYIKMWIRRCRELESYLYVWMMVECNPGKVESTYTYAHLLKQKKWKKATTTSEKKKSFQWKTNEFNVIFILIEFFVGCVRIESETENSDDTVGERKTQQKRDDAQAHRSWDSKCVAVIMAISHGLWHSLLVVSQSIERWIACARVRLADSNITIKCKIFAYRWVNINK